MLPTEVLSVFHLFHYLLLVLSCQLRECPKLNQYYFYFLLLMFVLRIATEQMHQLTDCVWFYLFQPQSLFETFLLHPLSRLSFVGYPYVGDLYVGDLFVLLFHLLGSISIFQKLSLTNGLKDR